MDQPAAPIHRLKHPEFWLIATVILILPPAYFWLFGLFRLVGIDIPIAADMLQRLPEGVGVTLVFILPFAALLSSVICCRLMRNSFTVSLLGLSGVLATATILVSVF